MFAVSSCVVVLGDVDDRGVTMINGCDVVWVLRER